VDCYVVATGKTYIMNDLLVSGLESIGCIAVAGQKVHWVDVAGKRFRK
jgi:hypothetical protein